jgi:hypothetical protein
MIKYYFPFHQCYTKILFLLCLLNLKVSITAEAVNPNNKPTQIPCTNRIATIGVISKETPRLLLPQELPSVNMEKDI